MEDSDESVNGQVHLHERLVQLRERMRLLLEQVSVEQRVFYRLSQTQRDDASASLYGIAMELAKLEAMLTEALDETET